MKKLISTILFTICISQIVFSQSKPSLEPCDCKFKADSSLVTTCGYLLVPENRTNKQSKTIKLPYIYVQNKSPNKKNDPVLFTTGGPGGSSLNSVESIHYFEFIKDRDFIAFEQRGTKYALPCLECQEINDAVKFAYTNNLSKDSLINIAVAKCRKRLIANGIDITGYNTSESTDDIEDLRKLLKIDSLNLIGMSYSGGLMLNVLKRYSAHIRALILDSPLPLSINIDEDELANFNEALHQVFIELNDLPLEAKLKNYLYSIENKSLTTEYTDTITRKLYQIKYGRNEILDILGSKVGNEEDRKTIPQFINDLTDGKNKKAINNYIANIFNNDSKYSGMRLSVYCSDKMAYANKKIAGQQFNIYPFMKNYNPNDVSFSMCNCWQVPAINSDNKKPFYSNIPMLLGAGNFDAACRPIYNDILNHYFPNSHRLLFYKKGHGPLISFEGNQIIADFLNNPYNKIEIKSEDIKSY
jgi:pimeloyl-ACP methyl ester carboxylesterase